MQDDDVNVLALYFVGGRLSNQPSYARERRYYSDPAKHVKFESETIGGEMEEAMRTKEIEGVLRHELENWLRWGRKKDWLPVSFRCPLGFLFKSSDARSGHEARPLPSDEFEAVKLERIVVSLPQKHRQAFVMYHLDRAASNGLIKILKGRTEKARHLGVSERHYNRLVFEAHNMMLRNLRTR